MLSSTFDFLHSISLTRTYLSDRSFMTNCVLKKMKSEKIFVFMRSPYSLRYTCNVSPGNSIFAHTVKPVHSDHIKDPLIVAVVNRCTLFRGPICKIHKLDCDFKTVVVVDSGRYSEVVVNRFDCICFIWLWFKIRVILFQFKDI